MAGSALRKSLWSGVALAGLLLLAMGALVALASRVRDWAVMTDEMQYAKLATNIGRTLSPWPTLRGVHVSIYSQLYPVLLSPLYGLLSPTAAFRATHVLNAFLFASAAVPAYLLSRETRLTRQWSGVVALLSIVVPWNTLAAFVLTESAAYPLFLWAVLASLRAVAVPSPGRDALALAVIAAAVLARTQFLALGVAFVVAAVLYERRGHAVLAGVSAAVIIAGALGGSRVLGNYSVTAHGWPLPLAAFEYAGAHIDEVGIGIALLPLLLGGSWLVVNAHRDPFALLALVTVVVLTLETSSFDVRFGNSIVRDRYMFYVAPLLLVAMARALAAQQIPRITLLLTTWFVALTGFVYAYPTIPGFWQDSPAGVLHALIQHLRGPAFVAAAATVLAVTVLLLTSRPRALSVASVTFVLVAAAATSGVAWSRILTGRGPSGRQIIRGPQRAGWIDAVLPNHPRVAIIPYADSQRWLRNAGRWWDAEFWNADVRAAYTIDGSWDYTPFPSRDLVVDPKTGVIAGTRDAAPYVVSAASDARLQLVGRRVATTHGLILLRAERPYRALWQTAGLDPDGWTRPGRPARIRVFGRGSALVLMRQADGRTAKVCGGRTMVLPNKSTGFVARTPYGPSTQGRRRVGMRVLTVRVLPSCLHRSRDRRAH
jgi:hypothetical protein